MKLTQWLWLIAIVVAIGGLQVTWRNMIVLKGYAVGEGVSRAHTQETGLLWLQAQVEGLASPARLSRVAEEHRLQFVAWSTLSQIPGSERVLRSPASAGRPEATAQALLHIAAIDPGQPTTHESSD